MENKLPQTLKELLDYHPVFRRKITYKELADYIGVSQPSVAMYASGERTPTVETLLKIAEYLQVSIDYLLTGKETEKKVTGNKMLNELLALQHQTSELMKKTEELIAEQEEHQ